MNPLKECFQNAPRHGHHDSRLALAAACGTGSLGHHQRQCLACDHRDWVANACRSRACPFCRNRERAEWARCTESALPPVPYMHAVFTVPQELRTLAWLDDAIFYRTLMTSVKDALLHICQDPKHLGVTPAMFAVLHTWNQRLTLHPHVHVVISAGGLTSDGRWHWSGSGRKRAFLVPKGIIRAHFITLLINNLIKAFKSREKDHPWHQRWRNVSAFKHFLLQQRKKKWKIHIERPLAGPQAVVRYLAGYVNRVAIAPSRVTEYDGSHIAFRWTDRNGKAGPQERIERLSAHDFLQRYRQHIPPPRFVRIRFWGLMANRKRSEHTKRVATALKEAPPPPAGLAKPFHHTPPTQAQTQVHLTGMTCPKCHVKGAFGYIGHHHRKKDYEEMSDSLEQNSHRPHWPPPDSIAKEEKIASETVA